MDSEHTKKTSPPLESMPSLSVKSVSDKVSEITSPTKTNKVRFENEFEDIEIPKKASKHGTSKDIIAEMKRDPFSATVKSPASAWSSNRRID